MKIPAWTYFGFGFLAALVLYRAMLPNDTIDKLRNRQAGSITIVVGYDPAVQGTRASISQLAMSTDFAINRGIWQDQVVISYQDAEDAATMRDQLLNLLKASTD